jgi:Fuc2NAc and GlcNAc transferase
LFACAAFGFLLFNWQPAKIFMGDVGSGFLGYVFALLLVMTTWDWHTQFDLFSPGANGIFLWVILLGYFIVDATVTLIRRLLRGDAWYSAHRTHAYQKMVIAGLSHRRVTSTILAINLLWLTPMAGASVLYPSWALPFTLIALAPLVAWVLYWKAGTPNAAAHAR